MARWVIIVENDDVDIFAAPGLRRSPTIPVRKHIEQALEVVGVLDSLQGGKGKKALPDMKVLEWLQWNGILNDCDPELWVNPPRGGWGKLKPDGLAKLRRQFERMLEKRLYYRAGRRPNPRHMKRLVLELARAWDNKHGAWATRRQRHETAKDYGPLLELVLTVFKPIRPLGSGVADLVRTIVEEGKPDLPIPRLKWPD